MRKDFRWQKRWGLKASLILLLAVLAGCAGSYLKVGDNPARVRVELFAKATSYTLPPDNNGSTPLQWQWGLFLVTENKDLIPLQTEDKQRLHALQQDVLQRDTVFLVPPGKRTLRLIVDGYIGVILSRHTYPHTVAFLQEDITFDLEPGKTVVIKRALNK